MSGTKSERIRAAGGTGMCFARPERGQRHQRRRQLGCARRGVKAKAVG